MSAIFHMASTTATCGQYDQRKIAKCPLKLPQNNFTGKIKNFATYTTIA